MTYNEWCRSQKISTRLGSLIESTAYAIMSGYGGVAPSLVPGMPELRKEAMAEVKKYLEYMELHAEWLGFKEELGSLEGWK